MLFHTDHHTPWLMYNDPVHTNARQYYSFPGPHPHEERSFHSFHHIKPSTARLFAGFFLRNLAMIVMTWLFVSAAFGLVSFLLSLLLSPLFWATALVSVLAFPWPVAFSARDRANRCGRPSAHCRDNLFRRRHNAQQHHLYHAYFKGLCNAAAATALRQEQETPKVNEKESSDSPPSSKTADQEAAENYPPKNSTTLLRNHLASFRLEAESDDSITLSIDVPRFRKDELELEIVSPTDGILSVSGKRTTKTGSIVCFTKKIALDPTKVDVKDASAVKADLSLGVLQITLPKVKKDEHSRQLQFRVVSITTNALSTPNEKEKEQNGENEKKNEADPNETVIGHVETVPENEGGDDDEVLIRA
jgi:hypothetical protein